MRCCRRIWPDGHGGLAGADPRRRLGAPSVGTAVPAGGLAGLAARGDARRERAFYGKEQVLDLLFPGGRANTRAKRDQPRLPDDVFSVIACYYGGGMFLEEEAAAAGEAAAAAAREAAADGLFGEEESDESE